MNVRFRPGLNRYLAGRGVVRAAKLDLPAKVKLISSHKTQTTHSSKGSLFVRFVRFSLVCCPLLV